MKIKYIVFFLFLLQFTSPGILFSQGERRFDPLKDDIAGKIPPLSVLIDSATANNHAVRSKSLQVIVDNCKLKAARAEWTRNLGIQANMGYGNLYNYSSNSSTNTGASAISTARSETTYSGAFFLNMPLNTIVNRRNEIKLAKAEIEQAFQTAEEQRAETRQLIIRQYNDLILKQRLLRIRSNYLETARINMQMVEKEFSNGLVSVTEYTRITELASHAEADYETARIEFLTAYMVLEEMSCMKFHLSNS